MILYTQEIGSMRKPDYLIKAYNTKKEFKDNQIRALKETVTLMESTGLDNIGVGGEMFRWEMYKHPISYINGMKFYGEVRSFDNRYYKKAAVVEKLNRTGDPYLEEFQHVVGIAKKDLKVPITGPYTLMDWSFNEYYNDRIELLFEFAKIVRSDIKELLSFYKNHKKLKIQIDEPAATTHPQEMDMFKEALNYTVKDLDAEVHLHVCYSTDYNMIYDIADELDVFSFNLEYANRDDVSLQGEREPFKEVKLFSEKSRKNLGLGVIDVHTDFIESTDLIKDRIAFALKFIDPSRLSINPDCGLRTRSRDNAYQKLKNMVDATKSVEKDYDLF